MGNTSTVECTVYNPDYNQSYNEADFENEVKRWKKSRQDLKEKLRKIACNLDDYNEFFAPAKTGSLLSGIGSGVCILAAPFTGGGLLLAAGIVGTVASTVTTASLSITEFCVINDECKDANKLLEEHKRLTQSLLNKLSFVKNTYDLTKIALCFEDVFRVPATTSLKFAEQLNVVLEVGLKKIFAVIGVVINTISLIQTCKDMKNGSKYANDLRRIIPDL